MAAQLMAAGFPLKYECNCFNKPIHVRQVPRSSLPDDEHPAKKGGMVLRRNDKAIHAAHEEFWDKVWWNRHQNWLYRIKTGEEPLTKEQKLIFERAKKAARRIERKYGSKSLGWDDFER